MPIPGNLTVEGPAGKIEGSCEIEGREGTILVQAFDHVVELPSDERGMVVGRRVHRPLTVTKEIDRSTPLLYQAMCTGDILPSVKLDWYRVDETGAQELYFQISLRNAMVSRIHPWVPNVLDEKSAGYRHMEDIAFSYQSINWSWVLDGIEYEDRWADQNS